MIVSFVSPRFSPLPVLQEHVGGDVPEGVSQGLGDGPDGVGQGLGDLLHPAGEEGAGVGVLQVPVLLVTIVLGNHWFTNLAHAFV